LASGPARRIEVDRGRGVLLLVRNHRVRRAIHVSTGAGVNATPAGAYTVFRKELRSWSVPYKVWLPYASYFNDGIAFHESPDVPPFPASHGCVRVPQPESKLVYDFAVTGTAVVVR
jgi:lipoprotein-anchoring transpeptidase ErfK/SrfK